MNRNRSGRKLGYIEFDTQRISVVGQLYLGEKVGRARVVR